MSTILLIQDRKNNYHMADYVSVYGHKYAACGLVYRKEEIINTISLNAALPNFCSECYQYLAKIEDKYHRDIRTFGGLRDKYELIQIKILDTANRYTRLSIRYWPKLTKLKFNTSRKNDPRRF